MIGDSDWQDMRKSFISISKNPVGGVKITQGGLRRTAFIY